MSKKSEDKDSKNSTLFSTVEETIFSVSDYLDILNGSLKKAKARVQGEISGLQMYEGRSYLYFSVKDKDDDSTIKCFMWKSAYRLSGVELKEGIEVVVSCFPAIYKPNGSISLQIETVELVGLGALKIAYDKLKLKLEKEGIFDESTKRKIPELVQNIGVITSKNGAVINDFLSNIGKFGFHIKFIDSRVEGQIAVKDLLGAVKTFRKQNIDVLVIMRGGGSLESFLAFNNEALVRAVKDFPAPVLTGIGHDKDISLVALASDRNVSTPTAVAELLNRPWAEALSRLDLYENQILSTFVGALNEARFSVEKATSIIQDTFNSIFSDYRQKESAVLRAYAKIEHSIGEVERNIKEKARLLLIASSSIISKQRDYLKNAEKILNLNDPMRQLRLGYSIVRSGEKLIKSVKDVQVGENIDVSVSDGRIKSQVYKVESL
ncbi:MAG: exodeoxyribonuclease VII large subunit [Parcubacteria group bacterium]|nr:exodeoxyribonuclease VII large subunit [Parcubacteria group bacterium]